MARRSHSAGLAFGSGAFAGLAFALIALGQPPIPDAATLMKQVQAHQREMDSIRENYTFHRNRRVEELDKSGRVTKTTTQEREVFFVNGRQIGRLIKKDGVALSPSEEKHEQDRVRGLIERYTKTPRPPDGRGKQNDQGVKLISEILAVATVSNPRRVSLNGRNTLMFDFTGDPTAHAANTEQKLGKKLEGTLWIDEADRQVARLEVDLYDDFHVGGGLLANLQKGSKIKLEQAPVGEGLWLPTAEEDSFDARIVVKGMHIRARLQDSDFKRFNVETLEQIGAPKAQ